MSLPRTPPSAPVAAGRGSGGREFDIVPGQPDRSILVYRINSTDAGIMLPELGKRLGQQALKEVASLATPDTILAWHRKLIASMTAPRIAKLQGAPRSVRSSRPWWCA